MSFQTIFHRVKQLLYGRTVLGGAVEQAPYTLHLPPLALNQLNRLQLNASPYLPGSAAGMRSSLRRKPAYDFQEHRLYIPGDDVRFIDWKASARQEHVFIKQGEHPREATVCLLLDCSASMFWGEPPKSGLALQLAAAIGYLALSNRDRFYMQPMQPNITPFGPFEGKGQVPLLLNYLQSLSFVGGLNLVDSVNALTRRMRGGLVFVLSDLLGVDDLAQALDLLPPPTWDVIVLQLLHPEEIKPGIKGDFQMVDIETGRVTNYDINAKAVQMYHQRIEQWRSEVESVCAQSGAFYTLVNTNWRLGEEAIPHLRSLNILTPL